MAKRGRKTGKPARKGGLLEIIRSGKPPAAAVIKPAAGGPTDFRK